MPSLRVSSYTTLERNNNTELSDCTIYIDYTPNETEMGRRLMRVPEGGGGEVSGLSPTFVIIDGGLSGGTYINLTRNHSMSQFDASDTSSHRNCILIQKAGNFEITCYYRDLLYSVLWGYFPQQ